MTDFNYKKYSLERLEEWMHDAISSAESSPQEIYDVIKRVVEEQYYYHKHHTGRCYDLLALLNGNGKGHIKAYDDYVTDPKGNQVKVCDKDDSSPECQGAWSSFWNDDHTEALTYGQMVDNGYEMTGDGFWIPPQEDKVTKWQLPVESDGPSGEYFITFPDDLLEAIGLNEGDQIEWIDQGDGSYLIKKV